LAGHKKISLYWKCQLFGWSAASLYWMLSGFIGTNFSIVLALLHFVLDIAMYISITHLYRSFSLQQGWHRLNTKSLIPRLIPAVLVLGTAFMLVTIAKSYAMRVLFEPDYTQPAAQYFHDNWLAVWMTGIRLMSIWVLAYYLYHYAQREMHTVKENARLLVIAKEAQLQNLASQLNPHFFFNSLNSIKALTIENPVAARRAIDLLSDLLRSSLHSGGTGLITVEKEMGMVNDYLELEKIRFEKKLDIHIDMDAQVQTLLLPPLCIQVIVENAIKHGIATKREGGAISIVIKLEMEYLFVQVQNPGQLNNKTSYKGIGIKNMTDRLQLQYNGKALFRLEEKQQQVIATLLIPAA